LFLGVSVGRGVTRASAPTCCSIALSRQSLDRAMGIDLAAAMSHGITDA
jgi:hypothetical protein